MENWQKEVERSGWGSPVPGQGIRGVQWLWPEGKEMSKADWSCERLNCQNEPATEWKWVLSEMETEREKHGHKVICILWKSTTQRWKQQFGWWLQHSSRPWQKCCYNQPSQNKTTKQNKVGRVWQWSWTLHAIAFRWHAEQVQSVRKLTC